MSRIGQVDPAHFLVFLSISDSFDSLEKGYCIHMTVEVKLHSLHTGIGDVANGFMCPDVLKTFDPPIKWNEEQKNQCCKVKAYKNGRVWRIPKESIKKYILESANLSNK